MINRDSQLILDFELFDEKRENKVLLSAFSNERDYFAAKKIKREAFEVELPSPFQETAWMDARRWRNQPQTMYAARDLGTRMWSNLPAHVRQLVLENGPSDPLRFAIASQTNGLDDIPWEWLTTENGKPVATLDAVRFVRLVPTIYATPPVSVALPIRVLIVLTNPKDERLLQPNVEIDVISQSLYNSPDYEVRIAHEPREDALRHELEWQPHIIHYVGHSGISGNKGCLIIHSETDGTRWLSAAEMTRLLPSSVRLVCLSTCVTTENYQIGGLNRFAHCPAEVPLPTTIVNQYALDQNAARDFWGSFYSLLTGRDGNIVEAFHDARRIVENKETDVWNWASFSLVVRDGTGQPFKISQTSEYSKNRFEAEIQAQWSARLANNLASRLSTLDSQHTELWESSVAEEESRLEDFEKEIAK